MSQRFKFTIILLLLISFIQDYKLNAQNDNCEFDNCDAIQAGYQAAWLAWKGKIQAKINDGSIEWILPSPHYCVYEDDALILTSFPSSIVLSQNLLSTPPVSVDMFSLNGVFGQYHTLGYRGETRSPAEIINAGGFFPDPTIPFYSNSVCQHFSSLGNPRSIISTSPNWKVADSYGGGLSATVRIKKECCMDGNYNGCQYVLGALAGCIVEFRYPCETYSLIKPTFWDYPNSEIVVGFIPLDHITCFVPVYFGYNYQMDNHAKVYTYFCNGLPDFYWVSWSYNPNDIQWNYAYRGDDNWDPTPSDGKKFPTLANPPIPMLPGLPPDQIKAAPWGVLSRY